jgi:lipopolysaccharide export system protein LptA
MIPTRPSGTARRLAVALCLILAVSATAQSFSFFRERDRDQPRRGDVPTVITSDTLDVDIAKDLATFAGHVVVEDEEMRITCNTMLIHLAAPAADAPATATAPPAPDEDATAAPPSGAKRVSRIVCIGDVIIIRKLPGGDASSDEEQKALAGRADYDIDTGRIVLTEDPILMRGTDSLRGERITLWRDSDKMTVEGGSRLEMKPQDDAGEAP